MSQGSLHSFQSTYTGRSRCYSVSDALQKVKSSRHAWMDPYDDVRKRPIETMIALSRNGTRHFGYLNPKF